MADLRRVAVPSSRTDRYVGRLIVLVGVAILVAVVKPWNTDNQGPPVAAVAVATSTPTPTPTPSATPPPKTYDFLAWGTNEPPPGWELWPAGTLSSFSFAMRIDVAPRPVLVPIPEPSAVASQGASPSPPPAGSARPAGVPAKWPPVNIPAGSSLDLVAVNHPTEYQVQIVALFRVNADGSEDAMHVIGAPSPWPGHFTIVGLGSDDGSPGMKPWPAGRYRLDIRIVPGEAERSIEIVIEPGPVASASPSTAP